MFSDSQIKNMEQQADKNMDSEADKYRQKVWPCRQKLWPNNPKTKDRLTDGQILWKPRIKCR